MLKEDLLKARNLAGSGYKLLYSFYKYIFKSPNTIAIQKHIPICMKYNYFPHKVIRKVIN